MDEFLGLIFRILLILLCAAGAVFGIYHIVQLLPILF